MNVPTFILKTAGDRSLCASEYKAWTSLPPTLRAETLAFINGTHGTVSGLLRCYLLATRFVGRSPDSSSLPADSGVWSMRKRSDSLSGSVLAIERSISSE